jgi:hypothetical protein
VAFVRVGDEYPDDPRFLHAGFEGLGAVVAVAAYCQRAGTPGTVAAAALPRIGIGKRLLARLLQDGLLTEHPDGYLLEDRLLGWQETPDQAERARRHNRDRQARHRARKRDALVTASVTPLLTPPQGNATRPGPKGQGTGRRAAPDRPRCEHGRILAADGAGCAECDQIPLAAAP